MADRIKAVLLFDKGHGQRQISEILLINTRASKAWIASDRPNLNGVYHPGNQDVIVREEFRIQYSTFEAVKEHYAYSLIKIKMN